MTRMPYRKFLLWNLLGAVVWAPAMVVGGFLAGDSFRAIGHWLGRASLATGPVVAAVVVAWLAVHRRRGRQTPVAPPSA